MGETVSGIEAIDLGTGGAARCGRLPFESSQATVCAWGDRRIGGLSVWFYGPPADARAELIEIRDHVQQTKA